MKLRRFALLLLALIMVLSALPMNAMAAGYYSDGRLYLDEISIVPARGYYQKFDFCMDGNNIQDYIRHPGEVCLKNGESVYLVLFETENDYNAQRNPVVIQITYSTEEFSIATELDSVYTLELDDFDPTGSYQLSNYLRDGYIVIEALPEVGELYLNYDKVRQGDRIDLNDVSRRKLS